MKDFFHTPFPQTLPWLEPSGPAVDIVLSTQGRLARNLSGSHFPTQASPEDKKLVRDKLLPVLAMEPSFRQGWSLELAELKKEQLALLKEKHLLGLLEATKDHYRHLLVSAGEAKTVFINGQDHLRLSSYQSGFQPQKVVQEVQTLEDFLDRDLDFAFQSDFGFLTANPANAGTGLRISVLMHLPGLILTGEIDKILNALRQLRFGVRGFWGRDGSVRGALFLITNLVTLGRDESEICSDFEFHLGKVIRHERTARQQLFAKDSLGLEDLAQRSLAVLQRALLMTAQEGIDRLSNLRLGIALGMLPELGFGPLNEAMIRMQSAHLEVAAGHSLSVTEKTEARAALLREIFSPN